MKSIFIILLLHISQISFCQNTAIFYEKIEFEFYKAEILDSFPVQKRISINKYLFDIHPNKPWFNTPNCLSNIVHKSNNQFKEIKSYVENQYLIHSDHFAVDFSNLDRKQFKVIKNGKGKNPKLFISLPHKEDTNDERIFVNIYEQHIRGMEVIYHLAFNKSGKITE